MDKAQTGRLGENFCVEYFKKRGFDIVCRNYHSRYGEIDIIAENGDYLAFVEVKTRKSNSMSLPREAVDKAKQRKTVLTAQQYLIQNENFKQPRFDVFEVWSSDGRIYKFNHIENAFDESALGGYNEIF